MRTIDQYKHVIWDWNGTLLNDTRLCVEIMDGMLRERGLAGLSVDRYRSLFSFPVIDYYRSVGLDLEKDPFEKVASEFIKQYEGRRREAPLQEGVRETLSALDSRGMSQSILSAAQQGYLDEILDHFELRDMFTHISGIDDHYARGKMDIAHRLMNELPCPPSQVLLVGDTAHDREVAEALRVDCLLVAGGHYSEERLGREGVPVLSSVRQVLEFRGPNQD